MIAESLLDREAIAGAWGRYGVARLRVFGSALAAALAVAADSTRAPHSLRGPSPWASHAREEDGVAFVERLPSRRRLDEASAR